jgi:hypothetical protein
MIQKRDLFLDDNGTLVKQIQQQCNAPCKASATLFFNLNKTRHLFAQSFYIIFG